MKKTVVIFITCVLVACAFAQVLPKGNKTVINSVNQPEMPIRKLTLSIDQSADSVSSDPALVDIVAKVPFAKGIAAYVNQPFDLTYRQEGLSFNVPRTHTLWLTSSDNKLTGMTIELYPLYEDNIDEALRVLMQWQALFDNMGLQKINDHARFKIHNIEKLRKDFDSITLDRFGESTGFWKKENTYVDLGIERFEREYFDATNNKITKKALVYKISISLWDVKTLDSH